MSWHRPRAFALRLHVSAAPPRGGLTQALAPMLSPLIRSISESELSYIAALDYGQESQRHLDSLRAMIFGQDGSLHQGQFCYPYEVIELGTHVLSSGHEREFTICTLLVIQAVVEGVDSSTDLSAKFADRAQDYDTLPTTLRDEILRAYQVAGC